jgi:hypothetical protein
MSKEGASDAPVPSPDDGTGGSASPQPAKPDPGAPGEKTPGKDAGKSEGSGERPAVDESMRIDNSGTMNNPESYKDVHTVKKKENNFNDCIFQLRNANTPLKKRLAVKKRFIDPTRPLPHILENLPDFNGDPQLDENVEILIKKRVLIISCLDSRCRYGAAIAMTKHKQLADYKIRYLTFEKDNEGLANSFFEMLASHKIGDGGKLVLLVSLRSSITILNIVREFYSTQGYINDLRDKEIMVIMDADTAELAAAVEKSSSVDLQYPHWEIGFLPKLLNEAFSRDPGKATALEAKLREQRKRGLWGDGNDRAFYSRIMTFLKQGSAVLDAKITELEEHPASTTQEQAPVEVPKDGDSQIHLALYIATYFANLSPADFDDLLCCLVEGEQVEMDQVTEIVGEDGSTKSIKRRETVPCVQIWRKDADSILKACKLTAMTAPGGQQTIDFTTPFLHNEQKIYFERNRPIYLERQFTKIHSEKIIFEDRLSSAIVDRAMKLYCDRARADPEHHRNVLLGIVDAVEHRLPEMGGITFLPGQYGFIERDLLVSRLARLMHEMMSCSDLEGFAKDLLERLMELKHHDAVLKIMLQLGSILGFGPPVNVLGWIRRLIDDCEDNSSREGSYEFLLEAACARGTRVFDLLDALAEWLPNPDARNEDLTPSDKVALRFILDYLVQVFFDEAERPHWASWPPKTPVLAEIGSEPERARDRVDMIMEWLFHPALKQVYAEAGYGGGDIPLPALIAALLEQWFLILRGPDPSKMNPEAEKLSRIVTQSIKDHATTEQISELRQQWRGARRAYSDAIGITPHREKERRHEYKVRREAADSLLHHLSKTPVTLNA